MRILDRPINIHIVRCFVTGFFCSDAERYGYYLDLQITRAWARSLYNRIKWSRSGFNRPIITYTLRKEISTQYLHDISFFTQSFTKFLISSYQILAKALLNLYLLLSWLLLNKNWSIFLILEGQINVVWNQLRKTWVVGLYHCKLLTKEKPKGVFNQKLGTTRVLFFLTMKNIGVRKNRLND